MTKLAIRINCGMHLTHIKEHSIFGGGMRIPENQIEFEKMFNTREKLKQIVYL